MGEIKEKYSEDEARKEAEKIQQRMEMYPGYHDYDSAETVVESKDIEPEKIKIIVDNLIQKYKIDKLPVHVVLQLEQLSKKFKGLDNVKGKRILDLGCGSNFSGEIEANNKDDRTFEPWFCRALIELGAEPVGVDIGNLEGEEFEHYKIDLSKKGALDFLPDKSFDGVNSRLLASSPSLGKPFGYAEGIGKIILMGLERQTKRLLKDNGKIIQFDTSE